MNYMPTRVLKDDYANGISICEEKFHLVEIQRKKLPFWAVLAYLMSIEKNLTERFFFFYNENVKNVLRNRLEYEPER